MSPAAAIALTLAGSYLLGSIPTSYLAGRRLQGVDLRQVGSGNLGATNVFRNLGVKAAIPVLLIDIGKGILAVFLAGLITAPSTTFPDFLPLLAAIGSVLGHSFSPWVGFAGGKGVATAGGAFCSLAPWAALPAVAVWLVLLLSTRIMSIASIGSAAVLPISLLQYELSHPGERTRWATLITSFLLGAWVLWRHRTNLERLRDGNEKSLW